MIKILLQITIVFPLLVSCNYTSINDKNIEKFYYCLANSKGKSLSKLAIKRVGFALQRHDN